MSHDRNATMETRTRRSGTQQDQCLGGKVLEGQEERQGLRGCGVTGAARCRVQGSAAGEGWHVTSHGQGVESTPLADQSIRWSASETAVVSLPSGMAGNNV